MSEMGPHSKSCTAVIVLREKLLLKEEHKKEKTRIPLFLPIHSALKMEKIVFFEIENNIIQNSLFEKLSKILFFQMLGLL